MGALQVCILSKLLVAFGTEEISYKELKSYLCKVHRISKEYVNGVIAELINSKKLIKTKTATYRLKENLQEEIINDLVVIHNNMNRAFN